MDKVAPRYNSGIQRAKGLLEIGAALYDTSLSETVTRGGTAAPQINSRVATGLSLRIEGKRPGARDREVDISFGVDGLKHNVMQVVGKELSLLWVNPNATLAQAYKGCPPFSAKLPVRAIAVFPSWDAVVIAVHESTGITSIEQIRERRYPLRVTTRETITPPYDEDATMFAVTTILAAAGFSLDDIRAWGGSIQGVSRPSHPDRSDAIAAGAVNAIFDEGVLSWGAFALERGFRILPIEGAMRERLSGAGYDMVTLTGARIRGLPQPVTSVDFSGWPMIVHADMPDDVAYALCEAIEARKLMIPTDNYRPLDLSQLCTIGEETPRGAPLHPGALRFYRERGYLREGA
ncbi:MAG TPA: TAXI family TRAP transporter solute-binding subunit [Stellaceae bacterium]|nr:TAXI family TRAP transporter solute-binding subunit [Stellaceae bacterium]